MSTTDKSNQDACRFCGDSRVTEEHHIVPRRFDGSDGDENLITVCPTCHRLLESLYDRDFYSEISAYVSDKRAYREGVTDTLQMYWENRVNDLKAVGEADWFEVARRKSIDELLPDEYFMCPLCVHPRMEEPCEHCEGITEGANA